MPSDMAIRDTVDVDARVHTHALPALLSRTHADTHTPFGAHLHPASHSGMPLAYTHGLWRGGGRLGGKRAAPCCRGVGAGRVLLRATALFRCVQPLAHLPSVLDRTLDLPKDTITEIESWAFYGLQKLTYVQRGLACGGVVAQIVWSMRGSGVVMKGEIGLE